MSAIETIRRAPVGGISLFAAVALIERALGAVRAWRRARATERVLAALSDAQLSDIGMHRGEIAEVADALARHR